MDNFIAKYNTKIIKAEILKFKKLKLFFGKFHFRNLQFKDCF